MSQPEITSRTGLFGVIGDPISHSLSPALHNHVLNRLGLDYRYLAFHVDRERAGLVGEAIRTLGIAGLNVTLPHKQALLDHVDALTDEARAVGAVNTVGIDRAGRLSGHNTDVAGFLGALELRGLLQGIRDREALVLGAGGAARAVLFALGRAGVKRIALANRTAEKARALTEWLRPHCPDLEVQTLSPTDRASLGDALGRATLTVNVTPLGMAPETGHSPLPEGLSPPAGSILYDTIYNPEPTLLMRRASEAGCTVIGGLDMLIIQGMESLCWWLGEQLPWRGMMDELRGVLREALEKAV